MLNDLLGNEKEPRMDIVKRLRTEGAYMHPTAKLFNESANEIERLRTLLTRQHKADAALYAMPDDCTAECHAAALDEHDAVHAALAAELVPNTLYAADPPEHNAA